MKTSNTISFIIVAIAVAIPGLYWQILDPILGIHTFGTEFVNTPRQMIVKGVPPTLLAWLVAYILYKKLNKFFETESKKSTEKIALKAVLVFLLVNIGFVINWFSVEVISVFYGWTTIEFIDLIGGLVIIFLWGIVPAVASALLFFVLVLIMRSVQNTHNT